MTEKNNPKIIRAWAMYDWANSVYPLVITTAIFPIYYSSVAIHETRTIGGQAIDYVRFFGREFINTELYSYVLSLSFLTVSLISPILSGIADYTGSKKKFLRFFYYLGSAGCAALAIFSKDYLELSMLFIFTASIGYWGSLVFYNAFLPEIADAPLHDKVSAQGFAYGYIGSSILLIANLAAITFLGNWVVKYCFLTVALWWAGFAQIAIRRLPNNGHDRASSNEYIWKGYQELRKVWGELGGLTNIKRFLRAFFVYSMGVQTVLVMAVLFAKKEIDWGGQGDTGLIVSVLIIQFIAVLGAYLFAKVSSLVGNLPVLAMALVVWVGVCLLAYFISRPIEFYALAVVVGLVMGGIQALSRSTYSKMLPDTIDHASYFSFYDVVEKLGFVVGAFLFGLIEGITSSMRFSTLALLSFFVIGLLLLLMVKREPNIGPEKQRF